MQRKPRIGRTNFYGQSQRQNTAYGEQPETPAHRADMSARQQDEASHPYQRNLDRLRIAERLQAQIRVYEEELRQERSKSHKLELSVTLLKRKVDRLELDVEAAAKEAEEARQARDQYAEHSYATQDYAGDGYAGDEYAHLKHLGNGQANDHFAASQQTENGQARNEQPSDKLISCLQQGQRNFLDIQNQTASAAALAFLIQHTLCQLMTAHAAGDAVKERVMYRNLHTIAQKMQQYKGVPLRGFKAALGELEKIGDEQSFTADFQRSPEGHVDEKLFQTLIKHLRDHAWIDLVPFYYDVDEQDRVYGFG